MQHALFDLLRTALVPKLRSNIAASTPCDIHPGLVTVFAVRAFPDQLALPVVYDAYLAIESAYLAVVALCIQLRIHNVVIDKFHNR